MWSTHYFVPLLPFTSHSEQVVKNILWVISQNWRSLLTFPGRCLHSQFILGHWISSFDNPSLKFNKSKDIKKVTHIWQGGLIFYATSFYRPHSHRCFHLIILIRLHVTVGDGLMWWVYMLYLGSLYLLHLVNKCKMDIATLTSLIGLLTTVLKPGVWQDEMNGYANASAS